MKSSEASFVKDARETRLAVDDAPARQPAPALVSFRTRVPNVRSSVSQASVAILSRFCRDGWILLILNQLEID